MFQRHGCWGFILIADSGAPTRVTVGVVSLLQTRLQEFQASKYEWSLQRPFVWFHPWNGQLLVPSLLAAAGYEV